ncbi:MAG: DUF2635 domain-containing protein [Smithella sp.]
MADILIKPAQPGLLVRDPITGVPLAADGERKPRSTYWIRRLNNKDVVEVASKAIEEKG